MCIRQSDWTFLKSDSPQNLHRRYTRPFPLVVLHKGVRGWLAKQVILHVDVCTLHTQYAVWLHCIFTLLLPFPVCLCVWDVLQCVLAAGIVSSIQEPNPDHP